MSQSKSRSKTPANDRSPSRSRSRSSRGRRSPSRSRDGERKRSGKVKKWLSSKGFGFIIPDDGGEDVYIHKDCLKNDRHELNIGENVTFFFRKGRNGRYRGEEVVGDGSGSPDNYRRSRDRFASPRRDDYRRGGGRDRHDDRRGGGRDRYSDRRGGGRDRDRQSDRRGGGRDRDRDRSRSPRRRRRFSRSVSR